MKWCKTMAVFAACGMLAATVANGAEAAPKPPPKGGPRALIEAQGGLVERMGKGPSIAVFYPAGSAVAKSAAEAFSAEIRQVYGFATRPVAAESPDGFAAAVEDKAENGAVLWIGPSAGLPATPLLVAPEAPWARLDLDALSAGASDEVLSVRIQKELWRGFAMMLGAANNRIEGCLMKSALSLQELDDLAGRAVCPQPFMEIRDTAAKLGLARVERMTYARALEEGWAPEPVNDVQRKLKEAAGK
ncbi:MAG: hypothetical protein ACOX5G_12505 [Kiritimatiellia bacterium]|jgi:hypothetical protein